MKCKQRFIRMIAVITFASAALSFSMTGMNNTVPHLELQKNSLSELTGDTSAPLDQATFGVTDISQTVSSEPSARLFQLMFILFLISPPLIAVMLFLIWKELKKRNQMK